MSTQWINHFCCFDTMAPHSFSYPFGVVVQNDSIITTYFEDDSIKVKIIDAVSGNDIDNFYYIDDSPQSSFYNGGDFVKCINGYLLTYSFWNNGENRLIFKKINNNFTLDSIGSILLNFQSRTTKLLEVNDSSFVLSYLSDSTHIIVVDPISYSLQNYSYDWLGLKPYKELYLNDSNEVVLVGEMEISPSIDWLQLKKVDIETGNVVESVDLPGSSDYSHTCSRFGDTLVIATGNTFWGGIGCAFIDMNSLSNQGVVSSYMDFASTLNVAYNTNSRKCYIRTQASLLQLNEDHSDGFAISLPFSSFDQYNLSKILFDSNDNPILFYSYINNMIVNDDLIVFRIDKNTGSVIDSFLYNDQRNTPDIAVTQFFDSQNNLCLLYANDYDDNVILQEETQLNLIRFDQLTNSVLNLSRSESQVYPNPTTGEVFYTGELPDRVEVFNLVGMKIQSVSTGGQGKVDLKNFPSGNYFLKAVMSDGRILINRIVKMD